MAGVPVYHTVSSLAYLVFSSSPMNRDTSLLPGAGSHLLSTVPMVSRALTATQALISPDTLVVHNLPHDPTLSRASTSTCLSTALPEATLLSRYIASVIVMVLDMYSF